MADHAEPVMVEVIRPKVWIESTMFGARIVVVHHEGFMAPFDYCQFNYRYGYTDNAGVRAAAIQMALSLGAVEPVDERYRIDPVRSSSNIGSSGEREGDR